MESRLKGGSSYLDPLSSVWKILWKLPTIPAVRMFMWKACNEALPTMANLMRRHIATDSQQLQEEELMEVAVICHSLWTGRNGFIHGKGFMHPNQVLSKAFDEIEAYKSSQNHQGSCPTSHGEGLASVWIQPPAGYYKLNWDIAINTTWGLVGIGAILRDHMGRSIGTLQARRELNLNLFSGEAYALMMVEGDAVQVIRLLSGSSLDCSYAGLIVEDAKRELNTFANWSAIHTRREGNKAAHTLARNALTLSDDLLELELTPVCIQQIVRSELFVMSF
ncbi:uncharacterized protein LOC122316117 [Carya illinoinensis]|uniref:uncharacterized protein LOC122316117 n=1 Tax=Carya illinoinensis TaxID=32201 RepID=UPI001C71B434|nr:uncharacterized protein LOC122316117 [Carya illinoinensis]